jgi:hypothetical protein
MRIAVGLREEITDDRVVSSAARGAVLTGHQHLLREGPQEWAKAPPRRLVVLLEPPVVRAGTSAPRGALPAGVPSALILQRRHGFGSRGSADAVPLGFALCVVPGACAGSDVIPGLAVVISLTGLDTPIPAEACTAEERGRVTCPTSAGQSVEPDTPSRPELRI